MKRRLVCFHRRMQHISIPNGIQFAQHETLLQHAGEITDLNSSIQHVALNGTDFRGLQPEFKVRTGSNVLAGQALFADRNDPDIVFTSPVSGTINTISTGRRRTLDRLVIECQGEDYVSFDTSEKPTQREALQSLLLKSGLWTVFRTRPFNRIPKSHAVPADIFVTAIDTEPFAADPRVVLESDLLMFRQGLNVLTTLTNGKVYVCQTDGEPLADTAHPAIENIAFKGNHPAGLAGTHIHSLSPVHENHQVWSINYQDVIAVGNFIETGTRRSEKIISIAGSGITEPNLFRVPTGANLVQAIKHNKVNLPVTLFTGSVFSGRQDEWLGYYHHQMCAMTIGSKHKVWHSPFLLWLQRYMPGNPAIIPESWLDDISPLTPFIVPLLRALSTKDIESAKSAGCLAFAPEDITSLSRVCPSGHDYSSLLNACLDELALSLETSGDA